MIQIKLWNTLGIALCLLFHYVGLFLLVYRCEKCYQQRWNIIKIVDHLLVDKDINESMRSTLDDFRSVVYSRPVQFTAMKFYRLDYGQMLAFCSFVLTYSLIIIQNM
ncbi:hypothetical protein ABMA28_006548 [Loxostege sticticalis]|uniref:Gustatory receptor n=1 Tax=Loxostege sticticalis TaxID=481309 RepID=A0ABD0SLJ7_LOXSC